MSPLLSQSLTAFGLTLLLLVALAFAAPRMGIIDSPCSRKRHAGDVPLVGGIAIFATLILGMLLWGDAIPHGSGIYGVDTPSTFMICGAVLVVTGALDDRFNLGVFLRIASEVAVALIVTERLDLRLAHLGDLLGTGELLLPTSLSYPFTVIAIFGIINAFNMLDGIDGLLASLVLVTLFTFHLLTGVQPGFVSMFIGGSLLAFLVSNLKLSPHIPKTFLGDAGSKLLGFIVVCLLLAAASTQLGGGRLIQPVTALFLVALPLFDMVYTTVARLQRRRSPFSADRTHVHHLMQQLGFTDRKALVLIVAISLANAFLGLMLHRAQVPDYYQFAIFVGNFSLYCLLMTGAWSVARRLQDKQT